MEVDKRDLIERIQRLTKKEKLHILNILTNNNVNFTKNSNGYFFNLNDVDEEAIEKMIQCLELIEKNRDLITEMDKRREELLTYYKALIEEKLALSNEKKRIEHMYKIVLKDANTNICLKKEQKLKGKNHANDTRDPDELINEYNEATKFAFKKGTSLYRLFTILKSHRFKSSAKNSFCDGLGDEESEALDDESDGQLEDIETETQEEIGDDTEEPEEDIEEHEEDTKEYVEEDIEEPDESDEKAEDVEEHVQELEEDVEETVVDTTHENGNQYTYLKGLLKRKGYAFSSNDLVYQEYIL